MRQSLILTVFVLAACTRSAPTNGERSGGAPAEPGPPAAEAAQQPAPVAVVPAPAPTEGGDMSGIPAGEGDLFATFQTSMGTIVVKLFEKDAPKTVANFVGLATGAKEWTDPRSGQKVKKPLYDGTVFHRVIPNFMIQGGDPLGTGTGDPGYRFEDEFGSGKRFDKPGLLAMANAGPNTNGSQFFITEVPTPHLNNRHTIFGEVTEGFELVPKIARSTGAKVSLQKLIIARGKPAK